MLLNITSFITSINDDYHTTLSSIQLETLTNVYYYKTNSIRLIITIKNGRLFIWNKP